MSCPTFAAQRLDVAAIAKVGGSASSDPVRDVINNLNTDGFDSLRRRVEDVLLAELARRHRAGGGPRGRSTSGIQGTEDGLRWPVTPRA